ncbi:YihY/virulence factor BrkB family protein [Comamonas composti]|uniref:YihY/virulence factor BrkB family protein n=1 Tax=Comamonas composti TaxID=408558 RepID=UPI000415A084|nr:YihY/virulence factor BrkB family protein [Comamonas composti]
MFSPTSSWGVRARQLLSPLQSLIDALRLWLAADGLRMSAAMSFYGILSLAPLLLLIVGLLGWWVDRSYVEHTLIEQIQSVIGERGAQVVSGALESAQRPAEGRLASIFGLIMLMSGATGVFVELQSSLEKLWISDGTPTPPKAAWWRLAVLRLRGLSYVLVLGFLFMVSMLMSTALQLLTHWAGALLQMEPFLPLVRLINEAASFAIVSLLFVGLMRVGTGPKPALRHLIWGGAFGALLFSLGRQAMAWYLSTAAVVSAYGAAGSLVVLLMWIYFSSAILLLAAAMAKALSNRAQCKR